MYEAIDLKDVAAIRAGPEPLKWLPDGRSTRPYSSVRCNNGHTSGLPEPG